MHLLSGGAECRNGAWSRGVYTNGVQGRGKISKVEGIDACGARSLGQVGMLGNSQNTVWGKVDQITLFVQIKKRPDRKGHQVEIAIGHSGLQSSQRTGLQGKFCSCGRGDNIPTYGSACQSIKFTTSVGCGQCVSIRWNIWMEPTPDMDIKQGYCLRLRKSLKVLSRRQETGFNTLRSLLLALGLSKPCWTTACMSWSATEKYSYYLYMSTISSLLDRIWTAFGIRKKIHRVIRYQRFWWNLWAWRSPDYTRVLKYINQHMPRT